MNLGVPGQRCRNRCTMRPRQLYEGFHRSKKRKNGAPNAFARRFRFITAVVRHTCIATLARPHPVDLLEDVIVGDLVLDRSRNEKTPLTPLLPACHP